jgi:hypothetical protein
MAVLGDGLQGVFSQKLLVTSQASSRQDFGERFFRLCTPKIAPTNLNIPDDTQGISPGKTFFSLLEKRYHSLRRRLSMPGNIRSCKLTRRASHPEVMLISLDLPVEAERWKILWKPPA